MKSLTDINIEKSRSGVYQDTSENRRLHRVGQRYGQPKKEEREGKGDQEGEEKPAGKKSKNGKLDEKTLKNLWASLRTIDDENTWDDAIRTHFGDKVADSLYDKDDGELLTVPMFKLAKKLPVDVIKRCIEEVGTEPEDGDTPYPGEAIYGSENKTLAISLNRAYYKLDKFLDDIDFGKLNDEQKKVVNQARRSLHESNKPLDDRKQMATVWAVKGGNPLGRGISESDIPKIFQEAKENFKNVREMLEKEGLMDSKKRVNEEKEGESDSVKLGKDLLGDIESIKEVSGVNNGSNSEEAKNTNKKINEAIKQGSESFTRVNLPDIPNAHKVNLTKYLSAKRKKAVDDAWGKAKFDSLPREKAGVFQEGYNKLREQFNNNFDDMSKSERAELLYKILKMKNAMERK